MNLKKYLIPLTTAALLALTAAPALATDINQGTTPPAYESNGTTNVTASVDTTYTITIPDNDVLKFENLKATSPEKPDRTKTFHVSAANVTLAPGNQLKVTVKGIDDKTFQMTNEALTTVKLPYTITPAGGTPLTPGGTIAMFQNGKTESVENTLTVNAPTMGAGDYADTLTFTCTVEGVNP